MPKADRDVYIVKVGNEYRVRPAVAAVKGQLLGAHPATVQFRNASDETILVLLPSTVSAPAPPVEIPSGDEASIPLLDLPAPLPGKKALPLAVTYGVYVRKGTELIPAKGESEPVLIIDP